jgi:hypothetical protein
MERPSAEACEATSKLFLKQLTTDKDVERGSHTFDEQTSACPGLGRPNSVRKILRETIWFLAHPGMTARLAF